MPSPALLEDRRCRRGERCLRSEKRTHQDEEISLGAQLEQADGLCPACTSRLSLALTDLPATYARLHLLHLPTLETRYRLDDITGGEDSGPPVLLSEHVDGLARKLDHELRTWAEIVADLAGVPWDSQETATSRPGFRVQQSCQLLGYRLVQWLAAGVQEYPARSTGDDPTRGHDPDTTTRYGNDWWCHRDGLAAACDVLSLYGQALHLTSGGATASRADHIPGVPCSYCSSTTGLRRDRFSGVVRCVRCENERSEAAHNDFVKAALAAYAAEAEALAPVAA